MTNYDTITDLDDLKEPAGTVLTPKIRWTDEQRVQHKAYQAARKRLSNQPIKLTSFEWLFSVIMLITFISGGLFITGHIVAGGTNALLNYSSNVDSY